ncbi:MAG: azurin [Bacteroidota bacterium]
MKTSIKFLTFLLAVTAVVLLTDAKSFAQVKPTIINLEANDQMKYNLSVLKAVAGKPIKLTLKHTGKFPVTAMGHNVVFLKPGTDVDNFASAALSSKDTQYIPASAKASIIAHTKLIGGGESDTITFTVAKKGTYTFICSFPGHYTMMKGKLIVE